MRTESQLPRTNESGLGASADEKPVMCLSGDFFISSGLIRWWVHIRDVKNT